MAGKILIVEDNSRFAEILAILLNEAERPDLILTDLNLSDMTAVEAITILKKIPFTSSIPLPRFSAFVFN